MVMHVEPSSVTGTPTFASQINAATRSEHTALNKLILARLPLCLPPISQDPSVYAVGISAFAPIFFAFEEEWHSILSARTSPLESRHSGTDDSRHVLTLLSGLHEPLLERSQRLKSDLTTLRRRLNGSPSQDDSRIEACIQDTRFSIAKSIREKPHVLIAYTWVMYMALFNGGRWMRQQMLNAGPHFWLAHTSAAPDNAEKSSVPSDMGCLSLWFFDPSTSDGEDLKTAFKSNFQEIASQLTTDQRSDITAAAVQLFEMCSSIVLTLDTVMSERTMGDPTTKAAAEAAVTPMPPTISNNRPTFIVRLFKAFAVVLCSLLLLSLFKFDGTALPPLLHGDW